MPVRDAISGSFAPFDAGPPVEWRVSDQPVDYAATVATMEARVAAIAAGEVSESVWLVEHPPLYTAGTSARPADLLRPMFPVHQTGRGGKYTYHGPGQRVAYVMLDLQRRRPDLRAFVATLEEWVIATLALFNVQAGRREDRVGVWVTRPDKPLSHDGRPAEDKIGAIGIRVRRWVSYHGIADQHFGVTSLVDLGLPVTMADFDVALRQAFEQVFGATSRA